MSFDLKHAADIMALKAVVVAIAPMAFESSGLLPENVEKFAKGLVGQIHEIGQQLPAEEIQAQKDAYVVAIEAMFADIVRNMRVRQEEAAAETQEPTAPVV